MDTVYSDGNINKKPETAASGMSGMAAAMGSLNAPPLPPMRGQTGMAPMPNLTPTHMRMGHLDRKSVV